MDITKLNLLIADDEVDILELVEIALSPLNTNIFTAKNGKEALSIISEENIAVCVLDLIMPQINGVEALKEISVRSPLTKSLILSAHIERDYILEALKYNLFDFVLKPVTPELLRNKVKNALKLYLYEEKFNLLKKF